MNDEKDISIRIRQTGKKATGNIFSDFLAERSSSSQDPECIFERESRIERMLDKNLVIERLETGDKKEGQGNEEETNETLTYSTTLKPMMRDITGALEERGELRIRRYERDNDVVWVVRIDRHRAKFLDRIFTDFIAFLKHSFNAE
jgi:hypothetical protein